MKIGILKETRKNDKRVAISPTIAKRLIETGFECLVQENAGIFTTTGEHRLDRDCDRSRSCI